MEWQLRHVKLLVGFVLVLSIQLLGSLGSAEIVYPVCKSSVSDFDNDGWGWENGKSCSVQGSSAEETDGVVSGDYAVCERIDSDPDGDGYGWENSATCVISASKKLPQANDPDTKQDDYPLCNSASSDADGDGFGWENNRSCVVPSRPDALKKSAVDVAEQDVSIADITDVVVVTGQSNVLGSNTKYNRDLDQPHPRVFAFTDQGWRVADLHQVWDVHAHPGNHSLTVAGNEPYNNMAIHFGKALASADSGRVVAFIVAADPGKGIANWDRGSVFYQKLGNKISRALGELPHKQSVDGVLWHQGENDWHYEGTSDAGATGFSTKDSFEYRQYYRLKLERLIANFRSESWGRSDMIFICGETRRAEGVNRRLMALNNDADSRTACVPAADLPKRADDPQGSHFSAQGLRTLGERYANKYRQIN